MKKAELIAKVAALEARLARLEMHIPPITYTHFAPNHAGTIFTPGVMPTTVYPLGPVPPWTITCTSAS